MMTDMEYSRNERSISSWISIGSIEPDGGSGTSVLRRPTRSPFSRAPSGHCLSLSLRSWCDHTRARPGPASDVEEPHVLGVALDEMPAQLDVVSHEYRADSSATAACSTVTCNSDRRPGR